MVWPAAMAGALHAATVASRVTMTRCRLLGLEGTGLLGVDAMKPRTLGRPACALTLRGRRALTQPNGP